MFQHVINILKINILHSFLVQSLQTSVCIFTLKAHFNSDTKFSLEILDLYLDFIKFTVEAVDLHTQVVPNLLKIFPLMKLNEL